VTAGLYEEKYFAHRSLFMLGGYAGLTVYTWLNNFWLRDRGARGGPSWGRAGMVSAACKEQIGKDASSAENSKPSV
jgi:hypothetical protein